MAFLGKLFDALKTKYKEGGMKSLMQEINKTSLTDRAKKGLIKKVIGKGFKQAALRAATVSAVAKANADARATVAKYNYMAYQNALDRYNKIIQQNPEPAENTGEPSAGTSNPSGSVYPVGND